MTCPLNTNAGLAVAKLLGFDICPRLRDLAERKLYLPRGFAVPEGIERVVVKRVSLAAIERGWDALLRWVASIRAGRVDAVVGMQRLGASAQGDPAFRAAEHLGRLLRTLFQCDYVTIEPFRREIHTLLNRGESVHQLQRAIYGGRLAPERGRRRDEMRRLLPYQRTGCRSPDRGQGQLGRYGRPDTHELKLANGSYARVRAVLRDVDTTNAQLQPIMLRRHCTR